MINLLPADQKEAIKYARQNTKLLNWSLYLIAAIIGLLLIIGSGTIYIKASTNSYTKLVAETRQKLESSELKETKDQVTELSNNVKLIINVLSKEILFSKLLKQAGSVMPAGTVLSNIDITEVKGGIDLTINAQDYSSATQAQVNLEDPDNKLFEKVDIVSISCGNKDGGRYPCTVNIRALFADDSPYLFINDNPGDAS